MSWWVKGKEGVQLVLVGGGEQDVALPVHVVQALLGGHRVGGDGAGQVETQEGVEGVPGAVGGVQQDAGVAVEGEESQGVQVAL